MKIKKRKNDFVSTSFLIFFQPQNPIETGATINSLNTAPVFTISYNFQKLNNKEVDNE
jgi:hypothetical protein